VMIKVAICAAPDSRRAPDYGLPTADKADVAKRPATVEIMRH
jgi:hypothetical protein